MTKYILCRPEAGLNDTLTQIELACRYGYRTKRVIVIDTAHKSCKHFRDVFGHYFISTDPNLYLDVEPFVTYFDNTDVYPQFITGRVSDYEIENSEEQQCWIETKFKLPILVNYEADYNETLLVHQYFGGGSISLEALRRLRLQKWIVDALHDRLQCIGEPYSALHIRNSDIKTDYIGALNSLRQLDFKGRMFLATDSRAVVDAFKSEFGDRIITFTDLPDTDKPLHYLNDNPRRNNTDAILDLLTIACSERVYLTQLHNCNYANLSGFSVLGHNLQSNKDILRNLIDDDRINFMI